MLRWPHLAGVALGVLAGTSVLALLERSRTPDSGQILSECDGTLRELVVHYEPSARTAVLPIYRALLGRLESGVKVNVVCPDAAAWKEFTQELSSVPCLLQPLIVNHPITTWSRDRWVALAHWDRITIWSPRGEDAEQIWPARAGDQRVGADIAAALGRSVRSQRSPFYFDGGDLLADEANVFVVPRVLQRNIERTVHTREDFVRGLSLGLGKRVILLERAPDHHAGMFMASIGNRTVLVGDPRLGQPLFYAALVRSNGNAPHLSRLAAQADFEPGTQELFDSVAAQCASEGYRVIRIPTVLGRDGRTYLTYVNALIDHSRGRRIVYMPMYRGASELNETAREVWTKAGFEVRPIDCTSIFEHFGCLHCLVNVLRRGP